MLISLQQELAAQRTRLADAEGARATAERAAARAEAGRIDAEAEVAEMEGKLKLAMAEVHARAERLEASHAQVATARAEVCA